MDQPPPACGPAVFRQCPPEQVAQHQQPLLHNVLFRQLLCLGQLRQIAQGLRHIHHPGAAVPGGHIGEGFDIGENPRLQAVVIPGGALQQGIYPAEGSGHLPRNPGKRIQVVDDFRHDTVVRQQLGAGAGPLPPGQGIPRQILAQQTQKLRQMAAVPVPELAAENGPALLPDGRLAQPPGQHGQHLPAVGAEYGGIGLEPGLPLGEVHVHPVAAGVGSQGGHAFGQSQCPLRLGGQGVVGQGKQNGAQPVRGQLLRPDAQGDTAANQAAQNAALVL